MICQQQVILSALIALYASTIQALSQKYSPKKPLTAGPEEPEQANSHTSLLLSAVACILQVTMGDILSDLPEVGNFTFSERAEYASAPKTPTQMWLQRDPPSWQASRESRADRAEGFMQEGHAALEEKIRKGENHVGGAEKVSQGEGSRHSFGTCDCSLVTLTCIVW